MHNSEPKVDWAETLAIPTAQFSTQTNEVIQTGIITPSARIEIIDSLATFMLVHTC